MEMQGLLNVLDPHTLVFPLYVTLKHLYLTSRLHQLSQTSIEITRYC